MPAAFAAIALVACDGDSGSSPSDDGGPDAPGDARGPATDGGGGDDAADAAASTCAITRAYAVACGTEKDLTCGPSGFDAWCEANDRAINSDAFRRAEAACLTADRCKPEAREDCEYRSYTKESPTASQAALVAAYCTTCEPGAADCAARHTGYDGGSGSVDDLFVAAWELSDPLVDEIRAKCTGPDAGSADAGACLRAFAQCSGGVYVAHLPDCPDGG